MLRCEREDLGSARSSSGASLDCSRELNFTGDSSGSAKSIASGYDYAMNGLLDNSAFNRIEILDVTKSYDSSAVASVAERISVLLSDFPGAEQPGICIALERGADFILVEMAAWMAGCFVVPIGSDWDDEKVAAIIGAVSPALIVTDRKNPHLVEVLTVGMDDLVENGVALVAAAEPRIAFRPLESDDIAYVIFTSGSTGVPKGVVISVEAFRTYIDWTRTNFASFSEIKTLLVSAELTFDIAMGDIAFALAFGTALLVASNHRDIPGLVSLIGRYEVGLLYAVPTTHHMIQAFCLRRPPGSLSSLRLILSGGDKFPWSMVENYGLMAPDAHFYNVYGPTEFTINCFSIRLDDKLSLKDFSDEVPIGECFEHLFRAFIDTDGFVAGQGELCVAGAQAMKGYLGDPDLTASSFVRLQVSDGSVVPFYRTGDLAFEAQGQIYVRGRIDGLVKNRGYRVHLDEISRAVETVPRVAHACAVVSEVGGIVVFVKLEDKRPTGDAELENLIMRSLPVRLVPDRLVFLENFPLNQSGKVDRKSLARLGS